jgi:hypothetical protein
MPEDKTLQLAPLPKRTSYIPYKSLKKYVNEIKPRDSVK